MAHPKMCTERLVSASKFIDSVIKSRAADPIYCSGLLNQVARFLHRRQIILTTANETAGVIMSEITQRSVTENVTDLVTCPNLTEQKTRQCSNRDPWLS